MSGPKIMFKTNSYNNEIVPIQVVKLTTCFITYMHKGWDDKISECKQSRDGFFETWEQAHSCLMDRANDRVKAARRTLELANANLGNIKGMKNPAASTKPQGEKE